MAAVPFKLDGARVRLRTFVRADIGEEYLRWLNDKSLMRFSNQRFRNHNRADAEAFLKDFENSPNLFLSIIRRADNSQLGTMTAYLDPDHGTADVGILIGGGDGVAGQGYGSEAWELLVSHLIARPDIRKVTCGTVASNLAMRRIAEKNDMEPDGARRAQQLIDGKRVDVLHYARFKS